MENFLFPVIKVKVIKVIKGFGGDCLKTHSSQNVS